MPKFEVVLNRCADTTFENEIACELCGQLGSCVVFFGRRVGKCCLDAGSLEISKEICRQVEKRVPYQEFKSARNFE